jgi:hypothetical protein
VQRKQIRQIGALADLPAGRITGLHPNGHEDVPSGSLWWDAADRDDTEAVIDRHHSQGLCCRSVDDQV